MRFRLADVRVRATAAAVGIVAIAMALAGILLVQELRTTQIAAIDTALEIRANDIESLMVDGTPPEQLSVEDEQDDFVQVIDTANRQVVAASRNISGRPPIIAGSDGTTVTMRPKGLDPEDFRVHVHPTEDGSQYTIVVGTNLENVDRVVDTTRRSLLVGLPVLLALIAAVTWSLIGRTLRPVEAIRSQVAVIGGGDLHQRVPEPPSSDEIGRLARTMNAMLDRLESSNIAQSQFVSNASHELRTPISVIRHELEVGLRSDDPELLREIAGEVLDEALRMQRLVEDLLLLARRDGRTDRDPRVGWKAVDLDDIALAQAHRVATERAVSTAGVSAGQILGDESQLVRVVRNLVDNALRHAHAHVDISVTSTDDGHVVLAIDDDGDGIAEGDRERIFERFFRLDESRSRDDGGSGLGLAIVAEVVADHGGTVAVGTSPTLGGARFTATFPDGRRERPPHRAPAS